MNGEWRTEDEDVSSINNTRAASQPVLMVLYPLKLHGPIDYITGTVCGIM